MKKLYSNNARDGLYTLDSWKQFLRANKLKSLTLRENIIDKCTDYFYCTEFDEVGESGNCGKKCDKYKPRNGKNGVCMHHRRCYEETVYLLTIVNYYEKID